MPSRDPDAKKRRLIDAALTEFAAYGIAGARIERIAKAARCSAGLVYTYFDSKDDLFRAVFDSVVETALTETVFTPDDLPGYAGKVFDGYEKYPEIARFITWYQLEGSGVVSSSISEAAARKSEAKIAAVRAAQDAGTLTSKFEPIELLGLVLQVAGIWSSGTPEFVALAGTYSRERRRQLVVDAVAALIDQPRS
jgi:AcrR family transcriptional regulator